MKTILQGKPVDVNILTVNKKHAEMALKSRVYKDWVLSLDDSFEITSIYIQAVDFHGKPAIKRVMFVRLYVTFMTPNGPDRRVAELRGGSCGFLGILTCEGVDYTVLVKQSRLPVGKRNLAELPAGMIDRGTFVGAMMREIKEELGFEFKEDELINLNKGISQKDNGIDMSPGLLDEEICFYLGRREVTREELEELQGKATGVAAEGEYITLWIVPLSELVHATYDAKVFVALALYHHFKGGTFG